MRATLTIRRMVLDALRQDNQRDIGHHLQALQCNLEKRQRVN